MRRYAGSARRLAPAARGSARRSRRSVPHSPAVAAPRVGTASARAPSGSRSRRRRRCRRRSSARRRCRSRGGRPRSRRRSTAVVDPGRLGGGRPPVSGHGQRLVLGVGDRRARRRAESGAPPSLSSRSEPKWAEITAPSTAIASRPATRETPLLTPEAMPTWRSSTESSTVAVSGATVAERPRPKTRIAGQHVGRRSRRRRRPAAAAAGRCRRRSARRVIGSRGPVPEAIRPKRGERKNIRIEIGVVARPGLERRVAGDLLEEEADEEEAADQPGVGGERGQVGDREVADAEEGEVEHRVAGARLAEDEEARSRRRRRPAAPRPSGRPSRGSAARSGRRPGRRARAPRAAMPEPVDAAEGVRVAALLDRVQGERRRWPRSAAG